jgi:glyoxylase-like metal-dependent hydrolase (beta-lactamase superfamily II)
MIATHGHFDHVLAAYELQLAFDIPFLIHPKDKNLLSRMASSAKYWLEKEIIEKPPGEVTEATSEDIVEFGKSQLQILHTPGHTPGGIVLFNTKENIIFTGDTIFKKGVGRTDLSYSSATLMKKSLKRIKSKFKGFEAYPGHGEIFYI